jgi:hypothetical protein
MNVYRGMERESHAFFTLTLGGMSGQLHTPVTSQGEKTMCWYALEWASLLDWI